MKINQDNPHTQNSAKTKVFITGIVTVFIFCLLFWEHFHGGVASHHILHQQNLPAISNWWSGLLLPILTWILISRSEKRLRMQSAYLQQSGNLKSKLLGLFMIGLVLGVLIATSFTNEYNLFLDNILYIILMLSLIVPIYYAEFMLGFILGMTYTFGTILPTIFILVTAAIGIISYRFVRPAIMKLTMRFTNYLNKNRSH